MNFIYVITNYDSKSKIKQIENEVAFHNFYKVNSSPLSSENKYDEEHIDDYQVQFLEKEYSYSVRKGDNLIGILSDIGFSNKDSYSISSQISQLYNLKNLYVGQNIKFIFDSKDKEPVELGNLPKDFSMHIEDKIIEGTLNKSSDQYNFRLLKQVFTNKSQLVSGYVGDSLYSSAISGGATPGLVMEYIRLLGSDVNFKRDIRSDSEFKILFNYKEGNDGKKVSDGDIIYAYLSLGDRKYEIYRYEDSKGTATYYHSDGRDLKGTLLSSPIKNARISSGFGMRYHPILKRKKLHKGVDYAARTGTPIMAAGNGVVQVVRYGVGYGKYLAIKHNDQYSTLYAHMSRFKPGIRSGKQVKKGEIIGYAGNTGYSTAVHLHYETREYGKPIDPVKAKLLISNPLQGQKLIAFNRQKNEIDKLIHKENQIMLAKNTTSKK